MGYNCSFAARGDKVEPYGDIAGPGVIVGFLGTGWLAVIFVLLHYLFVFDLYEDPLHSSDGNNFGEADELWRANPIDLLVKSTVRKCFEYLNIGSGWSNGLEMSILGMCDIQFVTGLGILISGFIDLPKGISAYHFILVTHLAWFSNLTHICGLTVLRNYFHTRPTEKFIRILCIIILAFILLIAMGPTLSFNWPHLDEGTASLPGTDAICLYNPSRSVAWHEKSREGYMSVQFSQSNAFQSGIVSIVLLVLSHVSRTIKFHSPLSAPFQLLRRKVDAMSARRIRMLANRGTEITWLRTIKVRRALLYSQVAAILVFRLYCDLVVSTLSDLHWLLVTAAWGTTKFFITKSSVTVDENEWTFGQVLPAFLLIWPVGIAVKGAFDEQDNSPPSDMTGSNILLEQSSANVDAVSIDDPEHPNETLEIRRFRQHLLHCLRRNYYDTKICPWITLVLFLMCIQILEATVLMFLPLAFWSNSAVEALGTGSILIFFITPTSTYFLFFACLYFEYLWNGRFCTGFFAGASFVVLGLYSLFPVWGLFYAPGNNDTKLVLAVIGYLMMVFTGVFVLFMVPAGLVLTAIVFKLVPNGQ